MSPEPTAGRGTKSGNSVWTPKALSRKPVCVFVSNDFPAHRPMESFYKTATENLFFQPASLLAELCLKPPLGCGPEDRQAGCFLKCWLLGGLRAETQCGGVNVTGPINSQGIPQLGGVTVLE